MSDIKKDDIDKNQFDLAYQQYLLQRKNIDRKDKHLYAIAWITILGFYVLVGFLMFKPIPKGSDQVLFILFGSISSGFGLVLGYFFGSSRSSQEKNELMSHMGPVPRK